MEDIDYLPASKPTASPQWEQAVDRLKRAIQAKTDATETLNRISIEWANADKAWTEASREYFQAKNDLEEVLDGEVPLPNKEAKKKMDEERQRHRNEYR